MADIPKKLRRSSLILGLSVILIVLPIGIASNRFTTASRPEDAMQHFYENQGPEDTLMDPLILAGEAVVPLVIERIKDKTMPRRRYAIGFLGNGSYSQSLPGLQTILQDSLELDYFRSDALHSIYQIDEALGLQYAQKYRYESNNLGKVSQDLLSQKVLVPDHRTYLDALLGRHD
jgi:hypothetical protein